MTQSDSNGYEYQYFFITGYNVQNNIPVMPAGDDDLVYKQFAMRVLTFGFRYAPRFYPATVRAEAKVVNGNKITAPVYVDSTYLNMYFGSNQINGHQFIKGAEHI